jgi:hypothetical protein
MTRTCMNSRYGTSPTGLGPISSKRVSGHDRSSATRRPVTSWNSCKTSGPGRERRGATQASLRAPTSFSTWDGNSVSGGGSPSPSSTRSMPIRCDNTSRTVHPGHSDGRSHSASARPCAKVSMAPHSSARIAMTDSAFPVIDDILPPRGMRLGELPVLVQCDNPSPLGPALDPPPEAAPGVSVDR